MTKRYSIAEARDHLPGIVHEVEKGRPAEITRRGKPVAILLSVAEYERLAGNRPSFWEAYQEWRRTVDWEALGDVDEIFADVRDRSPGRDFRW
jgi:antitoxin Phd